MTTSLFAALSIRSRVMVLAILPIVLLTLLLSSYMITSKLSHERSTLVESSQSIIRYLAVGAEFGLFSNNISALSSLSKTALERTDIDDVIFIDSAGKIVYRASNTTLIDVPLTDLKHDGELNPTYLAPSLWTIHSPVYVAGIQVDDFLDESEGASQSEPIGWVMLIIDERELLERQNQIVLQGILITISGLLITIWFALNIGRSITQPIQAIIRTVEQLRREELNARVRVDSSGELGELQEGINNLAKRVQDTRLRLEDQIEDATQNLRSALSDLERKNIDLDIAKQKAEDANEAKDQFLARMSHELRTPLTSVIGFSQLLQKTPLDYQQQEYSTIVQKTSALLLNLIDDVLDFSKIQSEAILLESIEFNLLECLSDVIEMQTPMATAKDIRLYFTPSAAIPDRLLGDPTRVRQIVTNLVSNAIKFTEEGYVSLAIHCEADEDRTLCTISVTDTGIGISDQHLCNLFQPFTQADTTITRRFGGSGLGLVISKRFAEAMGGDLQLHSIQGEGTTATVTLPLPSAPTSAQRLQLPECNVLIFAQPSPSNQSVCAWIEFLGAGYQLVTSSKALLQQLFQRKDTDLLVINRREDETETYYLQLIKLIRRHFRGNIVFISDSSQLDSFSIEQESNPLLQPISTLTHPICLKSLTTVMDRRQLSRAGHNLPLEEPTKTDQPLKGICILVAEDNAFNRLLLERFLSFMGAKPTLVPNGERALALARQTTFDCILMDVHMPMMDGIEASKQIRLSGPPLSSIPIIALTANVIANEAEALKEQGVETILFKPINEAKVIHEIQRATGMIQRDMDNFVVGKRRRLADYGISEQELTRELDAQITAIHRGFRDKRMDIMRDHSHQLTGLAGLLDLVLLETVATEFNLAVKTESWRGIWHQLWRLQRVINTLNPYEDN